MRAYLKLVRLPAVFTALADVAMGYLLTHRSLESSAPFALLVASSSALYLTGMAFNDIFDREEDARERPDRPIPSGRISLRGAIGLAISLLVLGNGAAWLTSYLVEDVRPAILAAALTAAILGYDCWLKHTVLGPLAMGGCRFANVLLGMSISPQPWESMHWLAAAGIGLYIVGVTLFARSEAMQSRRGMLALATMVIVSGLVMLWSICWTMDLSIASARSSIGWTVMWLAIASLIAWKCATAIRNPTPGMVQSAVRSCLLSLIVLDAAVVLAVHSPVWSAAILTLLIPAAFLGRWIDIT